MMPKKPIVLGGEKCLNEFRRQLVVAHRDAPLLADGCDQPAVTRVDPKRNLSLISRKLSTSGSAGFK